MSKKWLWRILYLALGLAIGYLVVVYLLPWLLPFLLAWLLARLMEPVVRWLGRSARLPRWLASMLCTVTFFGLIAGLAALLVSRIATELGGLLENLPTLLTRLPEMAESATLRLDALVAAAPVEMQEFLRTTADNLVAQGANVPAEIYRWLGSFVSGLAGSIPSILLFTATFLLSTYFISSDYRRVTTFIVRQIPDRFRDKVIRTKQHLFSTMGKWLRAQLILMSITFGELCVGFLIIGVEYALVLALVIALLDAMPMLGTGVVLIPWAAFNLLMGETGFGLSLLILFSVVSLARSLLEPRFVGKQIGLPPLVTLLAMYVGFQILGIAGMIVFPILLITLVQIQNWGYVRLWRDVPSESENSHFSKTGSRRKRAQKRPDIF